MAGSDAGHLREGQPVTVKFDTFPYAQHGTASGRVRVVGADSFTPEEARAGGRGAQGPAVPG